MSPPPDRFFALLFTDLESAKQELQVWADLLIERGGPEAARLGTLLGQALRIPTAVVGAVPAWDLKDPWSLHLRVLSPDLPGSKGPAWCTYVESVQEITGENLTYWSITINVVALRSLV